MLLLDDELVKILEIPDSDLKLEIAILLFQKEKISSGKAAEIAGISVLDFWKELSKRNIDLISGSTYVDDNGNLTL
jgi:predicted HTH domain antitoxin